MSLQAQIAALALLPLLPQNDLSKVEIVSEPVAGGVHVLYGRGGNIGLCLGPDGPFLIDDQFAPLSTRIQAEVARLSEGDELDDVRFVVNTHWHGDHTGGNENLGGAGAILVAHANVRERMSTEQVQEFLGGTTPASPEIALPVITFTEEMRFHWNGETIRAVHVPHAHTDGDALIHFVKADVLHCGDVFFNGMYPFIDVESGGSIDGLVAAVDRALEIAGPKTRFIPGHGPLATGDDLRAYRAMLVEVRAAVRALQERGASEDEIVAARPSQAFDEQWGAGFIPPEGFVRLVARSPRPQR